MIFAIQTFGCKVNQYESTAISNALTAAGMTETDDIEAADAVIINSCSVTGHSDNKAKSAVRYARRKNEKAVIVLTGCFPQASPEAAAETGADIITGTAERGKLPEIIGTFINEKRRRIISVPELPKSFEETELSRTTGKTRAFIKIEDGCDRFCSYCIIPYARGRVRSRSIESIKSEVEKCVADGHREIVLVGINLSCYGKDIGLTLADAVEAAAAYDGIERVRLSSLEPELLDEKMISRLSACSKLCPHFHLSLQSGCNETLRRMNRHYTSEEYYDIVCRLREKFPNCSITTDIMVGFAGETDEEFCKSLAFAEKVGFAKIHVFTYSVRNGTAAAKRTDHIPENVKAERYDRMTELDGRLHNAFLLSQAGTVQKVLVQKRTSPEYAQGLTPNYTPVRIYGSSAQKHDIIEVRITGASDGYCTGEEIIK